MGSGSVTLIVHSDGRPTFSANVGKELVRLGRDRLARITVLDAGQIGFSLPAHQDIVISREDADWVDAIHTNAEFYGFLEPLGHADFYPNGGVLYKFSLKGGETWLVVVKQKLYATDWCTRERAALRVRVSLRWCGLRGELAG